MDELFDEEKAVKAINTALTSNGCQEYPTDELLNIIDMIWDYYEENGLLEIDDEDDFESDIEAELTDYVTRMLKKDKQSIVKIEDVPTIISAELQYEDSLIDF